VIFTRIRTSYISMTPRELFVRGLFSLAVAFVLAVNSFDFLGREIHSALTLLFGVVAALQILGGYRKQRRAR